VSQTRLRARLILPRSSVYISLSPRSGSLRTTRATMLPRTSGGGKKRASRQGPQSWSAQSSRKMRWSCATTGPSTLTWVSRQPLRLSSSWSWLARARRDDDE
jgi:hypothetical protein